LISYAVLSRYSSLAVEYAIAVRLLARFTGDDLNRSTGVEPVFNKDQAVDYAERCFARSDSCFGSTGKQARNSN
jgi:hypothetical protein